MRVVILKDYNNIAEYTAKFVCNRINNFVANPKNKGKLFVLGLPTGLFFLVMYFILGSSPLGMYKKLIEYHKKNIVSFDCVKTFNMDEYVGKLEFYRIYFFRYPTKTSRKLPFFYV